MNMQDTTNRKRPAPGVSPAVTQQSMSQPNYAFQPLADNTDFSNFDFSQPVPPADQQAFADPSNAFDANNLSYALNNAQQQMYGANYAVPANTSTDLVRRSRNQQLAVPQNNPPPEQWNGFNAMNAQVKNPQDEEDEEDLDMKVALAKKDAQGKRRNILPFVQKLSSFLDSNNSNNTDLIRWSDDGRSFIVLDEDEFARTLIPEVFKHNNYASFVRQLNMYGFHKTVNITDGSLRQSEKARKGVKPPSMYSHPYFRRNRPDLLWLVQKPAGGNKTTKRKREDGYGSDEERQYGTDGQLQQSNTSQDLAQLPRNELAAVRKELQNLQTQQRYISQMITQLKEQNDTFYRQASTFQALHDRHESSINAILTFLATFYRQGLEGHGAQNLVNMFTNMPSQNQQQGSVVEEYNDGTPTPTNQVQRFVKRPPLLLPGPTATTNQTANATLQPHSAITEPRSARASVTPPADRSKRGSSAVQENSAPSTNAATPTVKAEVQTPNNDQMMDLINTANATTEASTPGSTTTQPGAIDMNSIVDRMNKGNSPLTAQQREDMVNSVLGNTSSGNNSALAPFKSATDPAQWKEQLDQSHSALDYLQQLQKQQDAKVQELNRRLQPLSPTGTIPGLHGFDPNQDPFDNLGAPGDYDPAAFINFDDPQPWDNTGDGNENYNFDFDPDSDPWAGFDNVVDGEGAGDGNDMFASAAPAQGGDGDITAISEQPEAGHVESLAGSEATSPAAAATAGVEDVDEDDPATGSNKRTRLS